MDFPILIKWVSPFHFRGNRSFFFFFFFFFSFLDEIHVSKQNSPRWDAAAFCGVTSGAILLPMSHKKDAGLIWINFSLADAGEIRKMKIN